MKCAKGEKMKQKIKKLEAVIPGLLNDAVFWDLCRTYGDYSVEVYRHLKACADYQSYQR